MSISEEKIQKYWDDRAEQQGANTVGFNGAKNQDANYKIRKDFIFNHVPKDLSTIDYGCGIGRYADCFESYMGLDITQSLLNIAIKDNPGKYFKRIKLYDQLKEPFDLLFTATVLQHNSNYVVENIFKNLPEFKVLAFYENDQVQSGSVKGRSALEYVHLAASRWSIKEHESYSHVIHGEKHTLTILYTNQP